MGKRWMVGVIGAVVCLIAGVMAWDGSAGARGEYVARWDVARGRYYLLAYGLPAGGRPEYDRLLRQRYGIEVRAVASCIVSKPLRDYVGGYNSVSMDAARRKFGRDVFEKTWAEATQITSRIPTSEVR